MKKTFSLLVAMVALSSPIALAGGGGYAPVQDINTASGMIQLINSIKDPSLQSIVQKNILVSASNTLIPDDTYNINHFFTKKVNFMGEIPEELTKHVKRAYIFIGQSNYLNAGYAGPNGVEIMQAPVDLKNISKGVIIDISKVKSAGSFDYSYTTQLILEIGEDTYIPYSLVGNLYGLNTQGIEARTAFLSTLLYANGYINIGEGAVMGETTFGEQVRSRLATMKGTLSASEFTPVLEKLISKIDGLSTETTEKQKKLVENLQSDEDFKAIIPEAKKLQLRLDVLTTFKSIIQETINAGETKIIIEEIIPVK